MVKTVAKHFKSNIPGYVALIIALSGAAYASSIPRDSVGTPQLKDDAVKTQKIAYDAVTAPKIAPTSVTKRHLAENAKEISGYEYVYSGNVALTAGGGATARAECPDGKVVVGGGFWRNYTDAEINWSRPDPYVGDHAWSVRASNSSSHTDVVFGAYALCVNG